MPERWVRVVISSGTYMMECEAHTQQMSMTTNIMIVAGEASGDRHSAKLVRALCQADHGSELRFFGAAGPMMRAAGVEAVVESDTLSIVGLAEIGKALPMFLRAKRDLLRAAAERKPDVAVLVDFPDFNLKLAKSLKKQGVRVVYYISPQVWAWREYRVSAIRKFVDLLITILPFEKDWYARKGIDHVEYVGNPLAMEVHANRSREEFCRDHGLHAAAPTVALLPGSRHKEIVRIFPIMLEAVKVVADAEPRAQFVAAASSPAGARDIERVISMTRLSGLKIKVVTGETYDALNASDAAAVTSGTATLEAGIIGTPMAIVYKTSTMNYTLLEPLISVDHYGLINLIAGERIAKELIQHEFTADTLAEELLSLLHPGANAEMRAKLAAAAEKLGRGGASDRAATAILKLLQGDGDA